MQLPARKVRTVTHAELPDYLAGHIDEYQLYQVPHQWRTLIPHGHSLAFSVAERILYSSSAASSPTSTCPTSIQRQVNRKLWAALDPAVRPSEEPKYEYYEGFQERYLLYLLSSRDSINEASYSKYIAPTNTTSEIKERVLWSLHQSRCNYCRARGVFEVAVLGHANESNPCGISHTMAWAQGA